VQLIATIQINAASDILRYFELNHMFQSFTNGRLIDSRESETLAL
jgi:hypothetical protein